MKRQVIPHLKNHIHENLIEAGCDEAGRGPLAGPVFAAAVILPPDFFHPLLDDSKKMTAAHRDEVREVIEKEAISWAVEEVVCRDRRPQHPVGLSNRYAEGRPET